MSSTAFQLFIENFFSTCLTILRILIFSDIFIYIKQKWVLIKVDRESIILGNGPSLNKSIENKSESLVNKDLVCVNFFPETEYYQQLKPKYYITGAPELWIENVSEEWKVARKNLFMTLKNKTEWDLILLIPTIARKHKDWMNILSENKKIRIAYYNITAVEGYKWFRHFCFKTGLGVPRPHNVITPALIQMLNFGYKKIYLLGADHSWLPDIKVDNENRVFTLHKHFYDQDTANPVQMRNLKMGTRKLHEVLHKFYHTFAGYFIIRDYASSLKADIYNSTPDSFIDAFERRDIGNP